MNWLKTFSLLIVLTVLVVMVGGLVGGAQGLIVAGIFALLLNFFAFWFSDSLALRMAGAHEVKQEDEPRLHNIVADVARLADMPKPRVFVIDSDTPNAFATGRSPKRAVVAVTTGIRRILNEAEMRGVIAHEMAHVRNRDMLIMTIVAIMAGVITFVAQMAMWAMLFGGFRGRDDNQGGGAGQLVAMLLLIILMPLAATVVRLAISRTREYAADETGARIIQDPGSLASALEKLETAVHARPMKPSTANSVMAHMYIVNPLAGSRERYAHEQGSQFVGLFSTHPPMQERVRRLREMVLG